MQEEFHTMNKSSTALKPEDKIKEIRERYEGRSAILVFYLFPAPLSYFVAFLVSEYVPLSGADPEIFAITAVGVLASFLAIFLPFAWVMDRLLKLELADLVKPKSGSSIPGQPVMHHNPGEKNEMGKWIEFLQFRWTSLGKRFDLVIGVVGLVPASTFSLLLPLLEDLWVRVLIAFLILVVVWAFVFYLMLVVRKRRFLLALIELILKNALTTIEETWRVYYYMFHYSVRKKSVLEGIKKTITIGHFRFRL